MAVDLIFHEWEEIHEGAPWCDAIKTKLEMGKQNLKGVKKFVGG